MTEIIETQVQSHELQSAMEVFVFRPEGEGPHPAILYAQHLPVGHTGIENDQFTQTTAKRLTENGYLVVVPFLFHWWPKTETMEVKRQEHRDDWLVADMQAGYEVLLAQKDVDPERIGILGHCWGGRVAWQAACALSGIKALAVFYGGNIKVPRGEGSVAPITLAQRIACPVIGFFGNDDANPSPEDVNDYSDALSAAGVSHEFYRYDGAGHAFQNFADPAKYREEASEDAWSKLLNFLSQTL